MIDLNFISKISLEYSKEREKNGSTEKLTILNLLKHCAGEVIEATDAYNRLQKAKIENLEFEKNIIEDEESFALELADIITCGLIIAAHEEIDIEEALKECLEKNRKRAELGADN